MKKTLASLLFLISFMLSSIAQVTEEERSMTKGMNPAMMITIPNADDKAVEKLWKKFVKTKSTKAKKIKKSEEWFCDNADIPEIGGSKDIDIYATFEQSGSDVRMTSWFDMGDSYLNSQDHPERSTAGEAFLEAFEMEVYKDGVKKELKTEQNNMKKLEGELKKLVKNNKRYHKEIEDAKKKIAKAEANIESNIVEQEEAQIRIEAQKEVVAKTRQKLEVREDN